MIRHPVIVGRRNAALWDRLVEAVLMVIGAYL